MQWIDHAKDFMKVVAHRHGIGEQKSDFLVWADHENAGPKPRGIGVHKVMGLLKLFRAGQPSATGKWLSKKLEQWVRHAVQLTKDVFIFSDKCVEENFMAKTKHASEAAKSAAALSALSLAGISVAALTSGSATAMPLQAPMGAEEISDVTLATFNLLGKDSIGTKGSMVQEIAGCRGCRGCGCRGCRGCGGRCGGRCGCGGGRCGCGGGWGWGWGCGSCCLSWGFCRPWC